MNYKEKKMILPKLFTRNFFILYLNFIIDLKKNYSISKKSYEFFFVSMNLKFNKIYAYYFFFNIFFIKLIFDLTYQICIFKQKQNPNKSNEGQG